MTHHLIRKTQMVFPFYPRTQVVGVAVLIRHASVKSPHSGDHCFRSGGLEFSCRDVCDDARTSGA